MARQMEIKRINEEFCKDANEKCKKALAAKDDATVGDADVLAAEANEAIDLVLGVSAGLVSVWAQCVAVVSSAQRRLRQKPGDEG